MHFAILYFHATKDSHLVIQCLVHYQDLYKIINPRHACAARVTVLGLLACVCVCLCLSVITFSATMHNETKKSNTKRYSATLT